MKLKLIEALLKDGKLDSALAEVNDFPKHLPNHFKDPKYIYLIGLVKWQEGKTDMAKDIFLVKLINNEDIHQDIKDLATESLTLIENSDKLKKEGNDNFKNGNSEEAIRL